MLSKGHLGAMRTSLTIHDTLRAGLSQNEPKARVPHRYPSFSIGDLAPGADLTNANQLASALEDDLLIEKLRFTCR